MNFKEFQAAILQGIPNELPEPKAYDTNISHAPIRKDILTTKEKQLALRNALRYFPEKFHKTLAPEFANELKNKLGDEIMTIKLFGSKVRGDYHKNSDIDIFILVKKKNIEISDKLAEIEVDYILKYNLPISTVLYSEFEQKKNMELGSFFFENIEKEGIIL